MHKVFQELGYYLETALKMGKTNVVNMKILRDYLTKT